jgi:hypothetical protein
MPIPFQDNSVQQLAFNQAVTSEWADLSTVVDGPLINSMDRLQIALWLKVDINDSADIQFRVLVTDAVDGGEFYELPFQDVQPSIIEVSGELKQLTTDVDQNIILPITVSDSFPYMKIQVRALVVGATPAVLSAGVSFTSNLGGRN